MEIQKTTTNQLPGQQLTPAACSQKLMQCLINLDTDARSDAKMELLMITSDLMPAGEPKFLEVVKYPKIKQLIDLHGRKKMLAVLTLMVKDFCSSLNVVRNMNEDQMIESAALLMNECGNFRMEDYVMMFTMAKKGKLVKIMDRIDINMITQIMDRYYEIRAVIGRQEQEKEVDQLDTLGNTTRSLEQMNPIDQKMIKATDGLSAAIQEVRTRLSDNSGT